MKLEWKLKDEQVEFQLSEGEKTLPIAEWVHVISDNLLPGISLLLGWLDQEEVHSDKFIIRASAPFIADITEGQARCLNLPQTVPFTLDIKHQGTIDQPSFRFQYRWVRLNGQPVMGAQRDSVMLRIGQKQIYRIPQPIYKIILQLENFNSSPQDNMEDRFLAWGKIRELLINDEDLPELTKVDAYLKNTRVAYAQRFTLDLKGSWDDPQFDPVPVRQSHAYNDEDYPEEEPQRILPPHYQNVFANRFKDYKDARNRYAIDKGWYLVADPTLQKAFSIVKRMQSASVEERRTFARNPCPYLRKELPDLSDDEINILFQEGPSYSKRVREIGLWQPKVLPWLKKTETEDWLPPEDFGLLIGGQRIKIDGDDIKPLLSKLYDAKNNSVAEIIWKDRNIPVTEETIHAVEMLIGEISPDSKEGKMEDKGLDKSENKIVLVIEDNLDTLGFHFAKIITREGASDEIPINLKTQLKSHQLDGLNWLKEHWKSGSGGALLADDMGLGKTLQALSFLAWIKQGIDEEKIKKKPLMIVAPTGLLKTWENEHDTHFYEPGLGQLKNIYGNELKQLKRETGKDLSIGLPVLDLEQITNADWILTTYETIRDYQHSLGAIEFSVIIFDEAQKIKTPGILMTEAAKAMNADFILTMTGTPIENRLADLWCICDTSQPGFLGELKEFCRIYENSKDDESLIRLKERLIKENVENKVPIMLRRMKYDQLSDLPNKDEVVYKNYMPESQANAYQNAIQNATNNNERGNMLKVLHEIRSISLHPFQPDINYSDAEYIKASARLSATIEILDKIQDKNEKALIFLESRDMQCYLSVIIQRRYSNIPEAPMIINGTVSGPKRQERVDRFQSREGFDVIILSPRAGGVGLTLTSANHVIHLSRWWNPAVEDQCTDRVYRIGQEKPVNVYFPQAIHPEYSDYSFDFRLHELLVKKRKLSREILMPTKGTREDLEELFKSAIYEQNDTANIDIELMEPREFEDWILRKLRDGGLRVERTPVAWDGGADGVAYPSGEQSNPWIIQCKHTQYPDNPCDDRCINDLEKAKDFYINIENPRLFAITNAKTFSEKAKKRAEELNIYLIYRNLLIDWLNHPLRFPLYNYKKEPE